MIKLTDPKLSGKASLEEVIDRRRSVRKFLTRKLSLEQISQLLWSAQGITGRSNNRRTAPSAGGIYPVRLYLATADALFQYFPDTHALEQLRNGDIRPILASAAFGQEFLVQAPVTVILITAYDKIRNHYGERGVRYADMEAGHIAQNIHLQATALGLGSVPTGAFSAAPVKELLNIPENEEPVYLIPVGYPINK